MVGINNECGLAVGESDLGTCRMSLKEQGIASAFGSWRRSRAVWTTGRVTGEVLHLQRSKDTAIPAAPRVGQFLYT